MENEEIAETKPNCVFFEPLMSHCFPNKYNKACNHLIIVNTNINYKQMDLLWQVWPQGHREGVGEQQLTFLNSLENLVNCSLVHYSLFPDIF